MISIITPVYNGEKFIGACLQNVIDQNCPNIEHIVVDGGSQDKTVEIIKQYAAQHPHIRWVSEKDQGQSDAMNKGIRMAKGSVIGILNVDDSYEPNTLTYIANRFKTLPEPSLLVGNCCVWGNDHSSMWISKPRRLTLTNILAGRTHLINPSAYFYHASLHEKIGLYKVDEHYAMDLDFSIRAAAVAHLTYVDRNFGHYHVYQETKTAIDTATGASSKRKHYYLNFYTQKLPFSKRLIVTALRNLLSLYKQIRSVV